MSDVDRLMRSYNRYTGDGLPGEPEDAPLPVGDPSSGVFNPKREELRSWGNAIVGAVADHALAAGQSEEAAVAAAGAVAAASGLVAEAVSAAEVSGIAVIYDTKAAVDAALAGLSEDDVVEVLADESQDDARTRYRVEGGLLVFKLRLGGLRPDQNLSDVPDPVAARNALGVELSAAGEMTVPYYLRVGFGDDATAGAWDAAYAFNVKGDTRLENRLDIEGDYLGSWPRVRLRGPLSEGGSPSTFLDMLYDRANGHLEMKLRDEAGGNPDSYYFGHALHGLWEKSVLRKVDADALYAPLGAAARVWEDVEDTYDFAVDGAIASVESLDLADGYEHRFFFVDVQLSAVDVIDMEIYGEVDEVYDPVGSVVGGVSDTDFVYGSIVLLDARAVDEFHRMERLADDETTVLGTGNSKSLSVSTTTLYRYATPQAIRKVKILTDGLSNFVGGKIIHQRRPL